MRLTSVMLIATLLFTTASAADHPPSPREAAYWKGTSMQNVIARLGTADQVLHLSGGDTIYVYTIPQGDNTFSAPPPSTTPVFAARGYAIGIAVPSAGPVRMQDYCSATFEVNAKNIIVKTSQKGSCSEFGNALEGPGN